MAGLKARPAYAREGISFVGSISSSSGRRSQRSQKVRKAVQETVARAACNLHKGNVMAGVRLHVPLGAVALVALSLAPAPAAAQIPGYVRVTNGPAPIQRWFRAPANDVLLRVEVGTTLDVLDEERGWYWVVLPPNAHGTRRAGWIRVRDVEPAPPPRRASASQPNAPSESASAVGLTTVTALPAEDRVTITERRGDVAAGGAGAAARAYKFDDLHFDRDRYVLRAEDLPLLQSALAALKADPALAVNIEGYTCNLGSPAYNLALGSRRADAVKAYLVSQGIAAERLHTISLGEDHALHDNGREETRRLNRRVALIANPKP
jgi:outer membrane protein OmpA-like peptidoglycan-associated protein